MKRYGVFSLLVATGLILAACASTATPEPTVRPTEAPEPVAEPTEEPMEEAMDEPQAQTIVDIAVEDGRFTTLVAALQAAELADTLAGEGPFTVFAPTDEAFAALPEGTMDALLADIPRLTEVLLYHVVDGKVLAAEVAGIDMATTLQGASLDFMLDGDSVLIGEAQVIITDIEASNGVIHVIDGVLLPPTGRTHRLSAPPNNTKTPGQLPGVFACTARCWCRYLLSPLGGRLSMACRQVCRASR